MFDHLTLAVASFPEAVGFYDRALAPLGLRRVVSLSPEDTGGVAVTGYGATTPRFWIAEDGAGGPVHIAFGAPDRSAVRAFHAAACAAGGRDNGAPGLRPHYHDTYYAAFVLDPDGNNIEAVCHEPAE